MNAFDQYQELALRSERPLQEVRTDAVMLRRSLIAAEAMGDYIDLVKKSVVYGKPIDYTAFLLKAALVADALQELRVCLRRAAAGRTAKSVDVNPRILHAALGYYGEAGEIFAALLHQMNGEPLDVKNLEEENGDMSWYDAVFMDELRAIGGTDKAGVWRMNIAKLAARYPEKFSLAESEARNVGNERAAMERARAAA